MVSYINKPALLAEIERLIKKNELYLDENVPDAIRFQKTSAYSVLCDLRHFLDTLEVKEENDLEKDEDYINDLIGFFHQNNKLRNTKADIINWLKSLKESK